ncbi:MAG: hypothetical protein KJO07_03875 [Deltaproteobacteria bacterium]|jgi:Flp pilus assembly pilin Flp|nr:hypothetical protein [Deltaproteobacteria bacterium]
MTNFINTIKERQQRRDQAGNQEAGLTTVEYIIILCLIAIFAFGAWKRFGTSVNEKVKGSADTVDTLETDGTEN